MTGFGRAQAKGQGPELLIEVKSVNHRFLDTRFKIPHSLLQLEIELKKIINQKFKRGSFDIYIHLKNNNLDNSFAFDQDKINFFIKKVSTLAKNQGLELQIQASDFLRSEFALDNKEDLSADTKDLIFKTLESALENLKQARQEEGAKLSQSLFHIINTYKSLFKTIVENQDHYQENIKEKLLKRLKEYKDKIEVDDNRLMQEVLFYLEKVDIQEEIDRVNSHLQKLEGLLKGQGAVGRQIDFLLQELGRETNTIGSKSSVKEVSDTVVQLKVQLEQMREQALNLE